MNERMYLNATCCLKRLSSTAPSLPWGSGFRTTNIFYETAFMGITEIKKTIELKMQHNYHYIKCVLKKIIFSTIQNNKQGKRTLETWNSVHCNQLEVEYYTTGLKSMNFLLQQAQEIPRCSQSYCFSNRFLQLNIERYKHPFQYCLSMIPCLK